MASHAQLVVQYEEVAPDLLLEIKNKTCCLTCKSFHDMHRLVAAATARREDLSVYFGLNLFSGRTRYSMLAPEVQRDIKAFLGNAKRRV